MCRGGFSPRKAAATLYLTGTSSDGFEDDAEALLAPLGQHTPGKGCLYMKKLDCIDMDALEGLIAPSWRNRNQKWPD